MTTGFPLSADSKPKECQGRPRKLLQEIAAIAERVVSALLNSWPGLSSFSSKQLHSLQLLRHGDKRCLQIPRQPLLIAYLNGKHHGAQELVDGRQG